MSENVITVSCLSGQPSMALGAAFGLWAKTPTGQHVELSEQLVLHNVSIDLLRKAKQAGEKLALPFRFVAPPTVGYAAVVYARRGLARYAAEVLGVDSKPSGLIPLFEVWATAAAARFSAQAPNEVSVGTVQLHVPNPADKLVETYMELAGLLAEASDAVEGAA